MARAWNWMREPNVLFSDRFEEQRGRNVQVSRRRTLCPWSCLLDRIGGAWEERPDRACGCVMIRHFCCLGHRGRWAPWPNSYFLPAWAWLVSGNLSFESHIQAEPSGTRLWTQRSVFQHHSSHVRCPFQILAAFMMGLTGLTVPWESDQTYS